MQTSPRLAAMRWWAVVPLVCLTLARDVDHHLLAVSGGFVEKAGSLTYRARFTPAQIASFLPANGARGPFMFPAPYYTQGVRLTNASDCAGGQDCVWYVGYSYWRNTNNHAGSNTMYILLGFDRNRGGGGPSLLAYDKITDQVQNLGPLFSAASTYSFSTAEGWYFSATMPTRVYTFLPGGTALRRYDVVARQFEAAAALDLSQCPRPGVCPSNAAFINQPHSSDDDAVHSVTVQDASFQRLGCAVNRPAGWVYVPVRAGYALDECHVDKSGRWLMVLEAQLSTGALDNRIVDLTTGAVATLADAEGGLGHLDMGFGYAVGADNYNPSPNATILLKFPVTSSTRPVGPVVHFNKRWDIVAANHIAHGNAVPGRPAEEQYACGSNASRVADMADEIVCFPLNPNRNADGSLDVLVAGQVLTDLDAPGGGGGDYEKLPKGNLDVTGRYFIWTTNLGGNRLDAMLVKIPADLITSHDPPAVTGPASVAAGGTITATVTNGPGNPLDWVGLYCPATLADAAYTDWRYLNNSQSQPATGVANATVTMPAPVSAQSCNLRLFINDGFTKLATSGSVAIQSAPAVTAPATVAVGGTITATVTGGPGNALDWVGLYCPATLADAAYITWRYLNNSQSPPASGLVNATVTFTAPNSPGSTCNLRLFANDGFMKLATSATITIAGPSSPSVTASPATVAPGGTITGAVSNGPANARDWVGLYCPTTLGDFSYLDWRYLNNTKTPPASGVVNATVTLTAPNNPGSSCNLRLFSNDGYTKLATSATVAIQ